MLLIVDKSLSFFGSLMSLTIFMDVPRMNRSRGYASASAIVTPFKFCRQETNHPRDESGNLLPTLMIQKNCKMQTVV